jgi:hypothetical protein
MSYITDMLPDKFEIEKGAPSGDIATPIAQITECVPDHQCQSERRSVMAEEHRKSFIRNGK